MKLDVRDRIGEYAITLEDGQLIYELIHPELAAGHRVDLDFSGVEIFASPFFNAAFGQLVKDVSSDDLNRLLNIKGLVPEGASVLRRVIQNSKRYYEDRRLRDAMNAALNQEAETH